MTMIMTMMMIIMLMVTMVMTIIRMRTMMMATEPVVPLDFADVSTPACYIL